MELSGQLHGPSALSPVATEQVGCVSLRANPNTLKETKKKKKKKKKKIFCPCLESNHDSSIINAIGNALSGLLMHKTTHTVLYSTPPLLHGRDETIFTLTYRQYTHTKERVGHLPTEKVPQNTQSKQALMTIRLFPSVIFTAVLERAPSRSYTPIHAYRKRAPAETRDSFFHSFQREITLCRVS